MLKKLMNTLMALTLALGVTATTVNTAEAGRRGTGAAIAAGIIGLGIAAAIASENRHHRRHYRHYSNGGECYPGPEQCGWRNRRCFYNSWGDYVCRGGRYTCWRPTYCD